MIAINSLQPLAYVGVAMILAFVALQQSQPHRRALYVPIILFAGWSFIKIPLMTKDHGFGARLGIDLLCWISHMVNILLVETVVVVGESRTERWISAAKWLTNWRHLRTVSRTPTAFSGNISIDPLTSKSIDGARRIIEKSPDSAALKDAKVHASQQSRLTFLLRRTILVITLLAISHIHLKSILSNKFPSLLPTPTQSDFSSIRTTFFRRLLLSNPYTEQITLRELTIRTFITTQFVYHNYSAVTLEHSLLSIVSVNILALDSPDDWPSMFGSLAHTYTIRGYWRGFWHRRVYRTYTSFARVFLRTIHVPSHGFWGRICVAAFVFTYSGAIHAVAQWNVGIYGYMDSVLWFMLNFGAVLVEDCVLRVMGRVVGEKVAGWRAWRVVGFVWVWGFMVWSLPKNSYRKMYGPGPGPGVGLGVEPRASAAGAGYEG